MIRLVVLISGSGTNLQAIIDACSQGQLEAEVVAVFSHRAEAYGLERASAAGIPQHCLSPKEFADRQAFDHQLCHEIDRYNPDLVVLAGFMRILSAEFVQHFYGRLLNIHPSLLPRYPGLNTHRQVLANGDPWHGASVHFVTEQLDGGPVILQGKIAVDPSDDEVSLQQRVQSQEYLIYPQVIKWFSEGRLRLHAGLACLDQLPLSSTGASK